MLDASRQKELALAGVWATLALAGITDSIGILAAGRHDNISLQLAVIFTCLSAHLYHMTCLEMLRCTPSRPIPHVHAMPVIPGECMPI